ncbi:DNA photolyase [candidate division KSB1 bacterium]|nr:DNA photolyase [candidate division KSB1 bacterium]
MNDTRKYLPQALVIEKDIVNTPLYKIIRAKFKNCEIEVVDRASTRNDVKSGKRNILILARQRGPFLRMCPGTKRHICCLYYNLDIAQGCNLSCSYCILQGYIENSQVTFYCNLDDMYKELDLKLENSRRFYRIGTGELSDSLTFDEITQYGPGLVSYFADKSNAILELKTKSCEIKNLRDLKHNRRTVVSWSLNSEIIAAREESHAPTIKERLLAAKEIQSYGYRLGFHFDPMIYYDDWESDYRRVVDMLFSTIRPENIAWISLGALRYPIAFDQVIRDNYPDTDIVRGELLPGIDLKMRYFQPLRIALFSSMYKWIESYSKDVFVYLCMESDAVWRKAFGWSPGRNAVLAKLLDDRVKN